MNKNNIIIQKQYHIIIKALPTELVQQGSLYDSLRRILQDIETEHIKNPKWAIEGTSS